MKCKNPSCQKDAPEGSTYCSEDCVRQHQEIKRLEKEAKKHELSSKEEIRLAGVPDDVITKINAKIPTSRVSFGGTDRRIQQLRFVSQILYLMNNHTQEDVLSRLAITTGMTKFRCSLYLNDLEFDYRLIKRTPNGIVQFNNTGDQAP